jgi:hypothetical protein
VEQRGKPKEAKPAPERPKGTPAEDNVRGEERGNRR